jgi:hypothetical protein
MGMHIVNYEQKRVLLSKLVCLQLHLRKTSTSISLWYLTSHIVLHFVSWR